jgi:hypothetical protein
MPVVELSVAGTLAVEVSVVARVVEVLTLNP